MSTNTDSCAWNNTFCEQLTTEALIDHLSERDIGYYIGIDQGFYPGVSINIMGSEWQTWLQTTLATGFKAFYMDLDWVNGGWSACDGDSNCATIENVTSTMADFITQTDTNIEVSFLRLGLRFKSTHPLSASDLADINGTDLSASLLPIQQRLLYPSTIVSAQQSGDVSKSGVTRTNVATLWPSFHTVLLNYKTRVIVTTDTTLLPSNITSTWTPLRTFALDYSTPVSSLSPVPWPQLYTAPRIQDIDTLANVPFRAMALDNKVTNISQAWSAAILAGYSPVLNRSISVDTLTDLSHGLQWPWAPYQPKPETSEDRQHMLDNQDYSMCALQTLNGWEVGNCHSKDYILCRNSSDGLDWVVSPDVWTPFKAEVSNESCPSGYSFHSPVSFLERKAVYTAMNKANISQAWTAVNSLSVENCWVDGMSTYCPYSLVQGNRNAVAQLTIASSFVAGLLLVMALLEYRQQHMPLRPLRSRTKNKRKKGKKKEKSEKSAEKTQD